MKSKSDIIKEMQVIAEEVQKKKEEIEILLKETQDEIELIFKVIEGLEQKYLKLAEEITKN